MSVNETIERTMEDWGCKTCDSFGDGPELADSLGRLIIQGVKTATSSSQVAWDSEGESPPSVGERELVLGGDGEPLAVIEWTELERRRYCDVDAQFAAAEGEGDLSLAYWRQAHREFFERNGGFDPEMVLVCMRFRLVHAF